MRAPGAGVAWPPWRADQWDRGAWVGWAWPRAVSGLPCAAAAGRAARRSRPTHCGQWFPIGIPTPAREVRASVSGISGYAVTQAGLDLRGRVALFSAVPGKGTGVDTVTGARCGVAAGLSSG